MTSNTVKDKGPASRQIILPIDIEEVKLLARISLGEKVIFDECPLCGVENDAEGRCPKCADIWIA